MTELGPRPKSTLGSKAVALPSAVPPQLYQNPACHWRQTFFGALLGKSCVTGQASWGETGAVHYLVDCLLPSSAEKMVVWGLGGQLAPLCLLRVLLIPPLCD